MAIYEQDVVMFETKENGDKVIKMPISRANNIEGIGRSANAAYAVGDVVYVDNNKKVALKCTTGGTTSSGELDVSNKAIGDTVADGSVVWEVVNRIGKVQSVNGQTGDVTVDTLPVGTIISYAGNATPSGFLDCNGAELNPNTYARLFDVIGTTYGGNGSTTFNLPNLNNNSFLEGSDTVGTVKNAGLPNILGWFKTLTWEQAEAFGTVVVGEGVQVNAFYSRAGSQTQYWIDASKFNSIYGNSETVQPKAVTVKYCIKY